MNTQKNRFGHRRASPEKEQFISPLTSRTNMDYRSSALYDCKLNFDHEGQSASRTRHSFDVDARPVPLSRRTDPMMKKKPNSYENIRNTLSDLKKKIETAKQTLKNNRILNNGSGTIFQQVQEQEEVRVLELNSYNESSSSQKVSNESSLEVSKREFLEQLRKEDTLDLSKMKGYYLSEIAKSFKGSSSIFNHIEQNWKVLKSSGGLAEPTIEQIISKKTGVVLEDSTKKILVLGLDGTLVHVSSKRKSEEDIDVIFKQKSGQGTAFISLRPYAMTFLKKMSKIFDVVIFSNRSKAESDSILDALDPFQEKCKLRLSQQNCIPIKNVWTKDLRVLGRSLADVLMVDHDPYSYLFQIDNAIPIVPFHGGTDDQLYSLQKYLWQVMRTGDVRKCNRSTFQLSGYSECGSVLQVVQQLYLKGRH